MHRHNEMVINGSGMTSSFEYSTMNQINSQVTTWVTKPLPFTKYATVGSIF